MSKPKDPKHLLRNNLGWKNEIILKSCESDVTVNITNNRGETYTALLDIEDWENSNTHCVCITLDMRSIMEVMNRSHTQFLEEIDIISKISLWITKTEIDSITGNRI